MLVLLALLPTAPRRTMHIRRGEMDRSQGCIASPWWRWDATRDVSHFDTPGIVVVVVVVDRSTIAYHMATKFAATGMSSSKLFAGWLNVTIATTTTTVVVTVAAMVTAASRCWQAHSHTLPRSSLENEKRATAALVGTRRRDANQSVCVALVVYSCIRRLARNLQLVKSSIFFLDTNHFDESRLSTVDCRSRDAR